MVKSIFDLEKRTDLKKECLRIEKYLSTLQFTASANYCSNCSFWELFDSYIEFWPYRYTAINVKDFFDLVGLPLQVEKMNNTQCLYYFQLILDFIMWLSNSRNSSNYSLVLSTLFNTNKDKFNIIIQNITIIMNFSNYSIEKINNHYTFIKRDADTDSILSIIENEDDLRLALLEYNDFRIENDVEEKKKLIFKIYQFIELHKKEYQEKNNNLYKSISYIVNNYKIRHSNNHQTSLNVSDTIEVYDICFKMMIHLIRDSYIKDSFKKIKEKHASNM